MIIINKSIEKYIFLIKKTFKIKSNKIDLFYNNLKKQCKLDLYCKNFVKIYRDNDNNSYFLINNTLAVKIIK